MNYAYDKRNGDLVTDDDVLATLSEHEPNRTADDADRTNDGQAHVWAEVRELDGAHYVTTGNAYGQRVTFAFDAEEDALRYYGSVIVEYMQDVR